MAAVQAVVRTVRRVAAVVIPPGVVTPLVEAADIRAEATTKSRRS